MRVKICGVTRPEHVDAAAAAGAAFIGLVFAERSRRHLNVEEAKRLASVLPPRTEPVLRTISPHGGGLWFQRCAEVLDTLIERGRPLLAGVFADQPAAIVNSIADAVDLDLIQLSGNERWEMCLQMRRPVLKTVRTDPTLPAGVLRLQIESGMAHLIHLDSFVPGELGGTGRTAAWDVAESLATEFPLMLAGGLTPANVGEAVTVVRPWAVDVSSGVERDGVKDIGLIEEFVRAAEGAAAGMGSHGG
jgi:phosphoribosylanthranilate isomerase